MSAFLNGGLAATAASPHDGPLLSADESGELISLFFRYISPFLPLIHKRTFRATRNHQPFLLNSMYAIAARFSKNPNIACKKNPFRAGETFYVVARNMVDRQLDSPHSSTVVGLLILALYAVESDRGSAAWMYIGLAIRMAQELKLNVDPDSQRPLGYPNPVAANENWIEKEAHRRIWWYCFVQDRYAGAATDRSMIINERDCRTDMPVSDEGWENATEMSPATRRKTFTNAAADSAMAAAPLSIHAHQVQLMKIFGRILDHLAGLKSTQMSNVTPALAPDPDHQMAILDSALRAWFTSLPEWIQRYDFEAHARRPPDADGLNPGDTLWPVAYLHAFYYLSVLMLHRPKMIAIALNVRSPFVLRDPSFVMSMDCANQTARILKNLVSVNPNLLFIPPFVAVCIFQSALVHIVARQLCLNSRVGSMEDNPAMWGDSELNAVAQQAERNLALHVIALDGMQRYWFLALKLGSSLSGLIQNACSDTRAILGGSNFISDRPWIALKGRFEVDAASDAEEETESVPQTQQKSKRKRSDGADTDASLQMAIQMSTQLYPYAVPPEVPPAATQSGSQTGQRDWTFDSKMGFAGEPL
ncbi:hypothetical protein HDU86_004246 [Geranomyces michiganensis]|nr:hypothetical protein HDU86_004246 [Geranomyces michiganensis]